MKQVVVYLLISWFGLSLRCPAQAQLPPGLLAPADTVGLGRVLTRPDYYRLQISLVRVRRDAQGRPHLQRPVRYHLHPRAYFYPASAVKLAAAVLALEKVTQLEQAHHLTLATAPMRTDSAYPGQTRAWRDTSAASGRASLAHYVRKMLLVSDNDAYSRLYKFVGPQELNASLRRLGFRHARLVHRLAVGDQEPATRHTNPIRFFADTAGRELLYAQPAAFWAGPLPPARVRPASMRIGRAYLGSQDQLINQPLDLSQKNIFALPDLQRLLQAVVLPETLPARQRPHLTAAGRQTLLDALSQLPPQNRWPRYYSVRYPATYAKFLLGGGGLRRLPPSLRIYNKIGQAYGFLTDNAYVVDAAHGVEFFLAATLYVNADGVLNDDKYEYATIGLPFLRDLGLRIYEAELRRMASATRK